MQRPRSGNGTPIKALEARTHVEVRCCRAYATPSTAIWCNLSGSPRYLLISLSIRSIPHVGFNLMTNRSSASSCSVGKSPAMTHPLRSA